MSARDRVSAAPEVGPSPVAERREPLAALAARAWQPALLIGSVAALMLLMQYTVDYEVTLLPWLASKGWVLYRDVVDQHSPLFTWLLVPLGFAGDPGLPLRLLTVAIEVLVLCLVYALALRLGGRRVALLAVALSALWSLSFDATHLWYDVALAPIYLGVLLAGEWAMEEHARPGRLLTSALMAGLLLGVGMAIKQHAVLVVPFAGLVIGIQRKRRASRLGVFAAGMALPLLAVGAVLAGQGALGDAWYWVVLYTFTGDYTRYAGMGPGAGEWAVLVALFLPIPVAALAWLAGRGEAKRHIPQALVFAGCLLAATMPALPRYSRFHLQAAVPLLALAAALSLARLIPQARVWKPLSVLGLGLLAIYGAFGLGELGKTAWYAAQSGPAQTPYAGTVGPLRDWVAANVPAGSSVFVYQLDSMLYRLVEREPPRPFVPQLPWFLLGDGESRLWAGFTAARSRVVLLPTSWWDGVAPPEIARRLDELRHSYHEAARFSLVSYPGAPLTPVTGLVRNDGAPR